MEAFEPLQVLHTRTSVAVKQRPSAPTVERTNGITPRGSRTREVSSRHKSPTSPFPSANTRRRQSPTISSVSSLSSSFSSTSSSASSHSGSRRDVSTERRMSLPSTPLSDTKLSNMKITNGLQQVLWPSTRRSLNVSFQSDSISIPVSNNKKKITHTYPDRALKPSCNVAELQRKRSPSKGKNSGHQSENSKPNDGLQLKAIDQHECPRRMRGGTMNNKQLSSPVGKPVKRLPTEAIPQPLQKGSSDGAKEVAFDESIVKMRVHIRSLDDSLLRVRVPSSSPSKTINRGASPLRGIRQSSPTRGCVSTATPSVFSFIVDIKKGRKLEDVHHLRVMYNRFLQWRFANARADNAMFFQRIIAEETLYNVWKANSQLRDSVIIKRVELERLKLEVKLNLILRKQIGYLEDWDSFEIKYITSLCGIIKYLKSTTLRLPVTGGAKANVDSLKAAIHSAAHVMQAMSSSIYPLLPKVEEMSDFVSELSKLARHERSKLDECDALLASTTSMQVTEHSLRTQLVQTHEDLSRNTP